MVNTTPTLDMLIATYSGNVGDIEQNLSSIVRVFEEKVKGVRWRITIAYNGNDAALSRVEKLAKSHKHIRVTYVKKPGKGNAILNGILSSTANYVGYMDADLATDVNKLPVLIAQLEHADLVSGSRYHENSRIQRDFIRLFVSKIYTGFILRFFLGAQFMDPQCGFKAMRRGPISTIIKHVQDAWFFFETEFTFLAQKNGLRVVEIPIDWVERPNSSVKLIPTIINFLHNLWRLRTSISTHPPAKARWVEEVKIVHDAGFSRKNAK